MSLFVRTVDRGSLTAAAKGSGLSPTMVGNHLQALEAHLGARLLNRTTRRQSLTDFGRLYYDRCVEILELVRDAESLALEAQNVPRGRLRITASAAFGVEVLTNVIADYLKLHPAVEVEAVLTDRAVDLVEDEFEVAVRMGSLTGAGVVGRPLRPYRLTVCAAPAYLEEAGTPATAKDLAEHRCLTYIYGSHSPAPSGQTPWRLTGPEGVVEVEVSGPLQADSAPALRRAALAGAGIVMLPEIMVAEDIEAGRLKRLLPIYLPPLREVSVFHLRDRRMSRKVRSFIDYVVLRLGPEETDG